MLIDYYYWSKLSTLPCHTISIFYFSFNKNYPDVRISYYIAQCTRGNHLSPLHNKMEDYIHDCKMYLELKILLKTVDNCIVSFGI